MIFFTKYLKDNIKNEIDSLIESNKYINNSKHEVFDIISYNEVALLSVIKSAFIRNQKVKEVVAIQEYNVYNEKNNFEGRADLYLMFRNYIEHNLNFDLLIEAKRCSEYKGKSKQTKQQFQYDLEKVIKQGSKYFYAESEWFASPTFLVTMIFEYHKNTTELLELYNNEFEGEDIEDAVFYQIEIIPEKSEHILYIYGHVKKMKE